MGTTPGFTDELAVEAHGVRLVLAASDPGLLAKVSELAPTGAAPTSGGGRGQRFGLSTDDEDVYRVLQGETVALACRDLDLALAALGTLVEEHVAFHAPERVFVNGGAAQFRRRAILVLGPPLGGTTTLVGELVRAGASEWCDRYAALDRQGLVHPYGARGRKADRRLWDADDRVGPLPVGMIVTTHYKPGTGWNPRPCTEGDGVLALLAHAVAARERPEYALQVVRAAAAGATVLEGERGEAGRAAEALLETAGELFSV